MTVPPDTAPAEWTIGRLLNWTTDYLGRHGIEDARLATEVLLAHAVECRRIDLYTRFEQAADEKLLSRFREWVRRAAGGEPVAYLVEEKEFYSLTFRVTRDVLIPRPETEVLVESVMDHCAKASLTEPRLLDIGTGSGCIAVTLLVQVPGARAVATDVSPAALTVARSNAERHGVLGRLLLVEADCLTLPEGVVPEGGFDVLVSNPPYVAGDALQKLDVTVRDYEPRIALSDGQDGLTFYRSIAVDAAGVLAADGVVVVEVGDGQAAEVVRTMEAAGHLTHRTTRKDRVVGAERVLTFTRK